MNWSVRRLSHIIDGRLRFVTIVFPSMAKTNTTKSPCCSTAPLHGFYAMTFGFRPTWEDSVRKLLENPVSEGNPAEKETSEVVDPQRFDIGSGGRI